MKLLVLIVLFLFIIWLLLARKKPEEMVKQKSHTPKLKQPHGEFHCVSIVQSEFACDAARRLQGQRILPGEAPPLPLPACDKSKCDCHFQHHEDRRDDDRRGYHKAMDEFIEGVQSRRSGTDRRKNHRPKSR